MKVCPTCKRQGEFYHNRSTPDGLSRQCKSCHKQSAAVSLAKFRAGKTKTPEFRAKRRAKYAKRTGYVYKPPMTPEEIKAKKRKHYAENKAYYQKKNREWVQNNPVKNRMRVARRQARKADVPGGLTILQWLELKVMLNLRCLCCGRSEPYIRLQPDHVVPISKGGPDRIDNIQPLCSSCNQSKRDKTIDYRSDEIRRAVAEWIERATGLIVPEFGLERSSILAYSDMPVQ